MKSLRVLKAAGLILAAVVLGLMTVQGSYALWNKTVQSTPGAIQAANFSILINNVEMSPTPIPLNIGEVTRGTPAYTSLDITNKVNATSALVVKPSLTGLTPSDTFNGNLTIKTVAAAAGTRCATITPETYNAAPKLPNIPEVAKEATQRICMKVELSTNTPSSYLGRPIDIPATLTVAQVAPVK